MNTILSRLLTSRNGCLAAACGGLVALLFVCTSCGSSADGGTPPPPAPASTTESSTDASVATQEPTDPPNVFPTGAPTATDAAAAVVAKVGDAVKVSEKVTWTVTKVTDLGQEIKSDQPSVESLQTTGRFILVDAKVSASPRDRVFVDEPKLVDSRGREYRSDQWVLAVIGDLTPCNTLEPDREFACNMVYEVPADAGGLILMATDRIPDRYVPISLGK